MELIVIALGCISVASALYAWGLREKHHALRIDLNSLQHENNTLKALHADNEQRFSALADAAFDGLFLVDTRKQIVMLNQAARNIFGPAMASPGKTLIAVTHNHEMDAFVDAILSAEEDLESQFNIEERSYRVRGCVISHKPVIASLAFQDVTELLRLTRARRDMVANFSHDLRTPISSIRLLVDTLLTNFGKNSERDRRLLGKIAGETDSLEHMTQELIDLSMIESGRAIIRMVEVDFNDIVNNALEVMATQIEQKKLALVNELPVNLRVLADPEQTRRVITNLVHNSLKFTPSGGQIKFSATVDDTLATIRVKDTGPGIPPQERSRIFERFYQVDSSRSSQKNSTGSGLGLSIAKHIIEAQGGKIWAEPGVPGGACICFTIPLANS
jgi:two-component system, OmpR family, phosphate regulon sensor histidine kinase PhoR